MDINDSFSNMKKRNNSNIYLIALSSVCILIIGIILLIYADNNTIDALILDYAKVLAVPVIYFMFNFVVQSQILDYDNVGLKIFILLAVGFVCFFISKAITSTFSQMVHFLLFVSIPAFIGTFHAFHKVGKMTNDQREKEMEKNKKFSQMD